MANGMGSLRASDAAQDWANPSRAFSTGGCRLSPQKGCAGGCCADVSVVSPQLSWLVPWQVQGAPWVSQSPRAACPQAGVPGEEVAPALRAVHGAAQAGNSHRQFHYHLGLVHGLNLNGKSREAPVYLLLLFI